MPIIKKHIKPSPVRNLKNDQLLNHPSINDDKTLTTNQGLKINEYQNSTKDGARGPTLLEDIILREKITHSDHEKIPERIVHARGSAAHGTFQARNNPALFFNFH